MGRLSIRTAARAATHGYGSSKHDGSLPKNRALFAGRGRLCRSPWRLQSSEQQEKCRHDALASAEPPRLFPEGAFEPTMDAPLTLDQASMPPRAGQQPTSLRVPEVDGGVVEGVQDWSEEAPAANDSENLSLPPSDRTVAIETEDDDAPLPELLPFETPSALAEHATPAEVADEIAEPAGEQPAETAASDIAEAPPVKAPVAEMPAFESPDISEPTEVAATPDSEAVADIAAEPAPAATEAVESGPDAPLVSTELSRSTTSSR